LISLSFIVTNGEYCNGLTIGSLGPPNSAVPEPALAVSLADPKSQRVHNFFFTIAPEF